MLRCHYNADDMAVKYWCDDGEVGVGCLEMPVIFS
jgi:hypothetical protein